ncbi:MAG TPA: hypothetical protein VF795_00350 [Desulfuromonadaceae bacterium]
MNGTIINGAILLAAAIFLTVLALHVRNGAPVPGPKPGGCSVCGAKPAVGPQGTAGERP